MAHRKWAESLTGRPASGAFRQVMEKQARTVSLAQPDQHRVTDLLLLAAMALTTLALAWLAWVRL